MRKQEKGGCEQRAPEGLDGNEHGQGLTKNNANFAVVFSR
jgi:hypothetical protein